MIKYIKSVALQHQQGSVYMEYVLSLLVLSVFLFSAVPGTEHSIVEFVAHSIRQYFQHTTYLLSLP